MFGIFTCLFGAKAQTPVNPPKSLYGIELKSITGKPIDLKTFKGKKILFVNVASKCGFTKQYEDLQMLHNLHKDHLVVIGLPCNQFGNQEPGSNEEIQEFCSATFGVNFVMTDKLDVKGSNQHPIYQWLTKKSINGVADSEVKWNFQKYLVDEQGRFVDFYYSITNPMSDKILKHLN